MQEPRRALGTGQRRRSLPPLPLGTRLHGDRYELTDIVDAGSSCTVYRALQLASGQAVAVKVFNDAFLEHRHAAAWVRTEIGHHVSVEHDNVVRVLDHGHADGYPYIVMELLDGENADQLVERRGPVPEHEAVGFALDLLGALEACHGAGIVHADVKPQNVVVVRGAGRRVQRAMLCDFGISRRLVETTGLPVPCAKTISGTPEYMSPEQAKACALDGRSDIYSLGITLFHMVTGRPPFQERHPIATAAMHVRGTLPSPRSLNPELSPAFALIIERATAKERDARFASADEMRQELLRSVAGVDSVAA